MEIGVTIPLQKHLKWKQPPYGDEPNLLLCWEAHRAEIAGRMMLVVVNAANRFAAIRRMSGADWKKLDSVVPETIAAAMTEAGVPKETQRRYFDAAGPLAFTKTHGRKSVGGLNRVVDEAWFSSARDYDLESMFQSDMTSFANRMLGSCATRDGYIVPREVFLEDLDALLDGDLLGSFLAKTRNGQAAGKTQRPSNVISFLGPKVDRLPK